MLDFTNDKPNPVALWDAIDTEPFFDSITTVRPNIMRVAVWILLYKMR